MATIALAPAVLLGCSGVAVTGPASASASGHNAASALICSGGGTQEWTRC